MQNIEDKTRRAATWLVGVAIGVNLSMDKTNGWSRARLSKMAKHIEVADAIHQPHPNFGDGGFC